MSVCKVNDVLGHFDLGPTGFIWRNFTAAPNAWMAAGLIFTISRRAKT